MSYEPSTELTPLKQALLVISSLQSKLEAATVADKEPIAIVGMACRFPGAANDPESFWDLLSQGRDGVREVPPSRRGSESFDIGEGGELREREGSRCGLIDCIDEFDPYFFGISPREASDMDPQQRLLLEVAWEAFEDAGWPLGRVKGSRTGLYIGILTGDYGLRQVATPEYTTPYSGTGIAHSTAVGRLAYFFDLNGPCLALDAACASSLVAVHQGVQSLRAGECDTALVGGVNAILHPLNSILIGRLNALAPDGRCKTFDHRADGYVRGEGCGLVVLKKLSAALADNDPIRAVIRGTCVNQDGRSNGMTAPNGLAQAECIREALARAGVESTQVGFVETHGTGTALGDPIEVEALKDVYGERRRNGLPLALGALKTNIGHLEPAAGIAGVIKAVLAMEAGQVPPNLHFEQLNPHIALDGSPITIPTKLQVWPAIDGHRYAGVSAVGLNGSNAHIILMSGPTEDSSSTISHGQPNPEPFLLPVSGHSRESLIKNAAAYRDILRAPGSAGALANICYSAGVHRTHHVHRLAVVGQRVEDFIESLDCFAQGSAETTGYEGHASEGSYRKVFVFSGQGPVFWPVPDELLACESPIRSVLETCDEYLCKRHGYPSLLKQLAEPDESVFRPRFIQPALVAIQIALARQWESRGIAPDAVVGHSLGEVAAVHIAGALSLEDALDVAIHRGRMIEKVSGRGGMAYVGLSREQAIRLIEPFDGKLSVAVHNSPDAVVVSGESNAIAAFANELKAREVFCRVLESVDFAAHSQQMDAIRDEFVGAIDHIRATQPAIAIFSTVHSDGRIEDFSSSYWGDNLCSPVSFVSAVNRALGRGPAAFIEIAPHPVLSAALNENIMSSNVPGGVFPTMYRGKSPSLVMKSTIGGLYTLGMKVDWKRESHREARRVRLPHYKWHREKYWFEGDVSSESYLRKQPVEVDGNRAKVSLSAEVSSGGVQGSVRRLLSSALQIPMSRLEGSRPLMQLGLDSLMAVQLKANIATKFSVELSVPRIMSGLSADELVEHIDRQLQVGRGARSQPSPSRTEATVANEGIVHMRAPKSPLENVIAFHMDEVLGGASIGDSGADVVASADRGVLDTLASRLSGLTPVRITAESIAANPSPGCLAALIRATVQRTSKQKLPFLARAVVPVGQEQSEIASPSATVTQIFCFPYLGGGASIFSGMGRRMTAKMGGRVQTYGIQLPGREDRLIEDPLESFDSLISAVVNDIRRVARAPYVFLGTSMGGLLAYEVARRLSEQGFPEPLHVVVAAMISPQEVATDSNIQSLDERRMIALLNDASGGKYDSETRALILPTLSADSKALRGYRYRERSSLACPVSIWTGRADPIARPERVSGWTSVVATPPVFEVFSGGHLFPFAQVDGVVLRIAGLLKAQGL